MMSMVSPLTRALLASSLLVPVFAASAGSTEKALPEMVVSTARLREQALIDIPASVTMLAAPALHDSAQQHFEEVLSQVPNLNWAMGSSRPRYFQIRGIGEREQYEGAPNASVGFLIDDIDFSGVGMPATLFDVDHIEVLRGPQGTILGANALGGIIAMRSAEPGAAYQSRVMGEVGDYDTRALGFSATGPVEALDSAWRISVQQNLSDGFRDNAYLHRDDTNDRDELTARGKWRWNAGENGRLDLTFMHANLDNGYDAWSIDNSRTTLSDHPGEDSQRVNAGAARWQNTFGNGLTFTAIGTALDSDSVHAFDGDWANADSWAPYTYDYVYRTSRAHDVYTLETRLASAPLGAEDGVAWLAGAYGRRVRERIGEVSAGEFIDPDPLFGYGFATDDFLDSRFRSTTAAVFAQLDGRIARHWLWSLGLRQEEFRATYHDAGVRGGAARVTDESTRDGMLGGHLSLAYEFDDATRAYAAIHRGYKAGGFNMGAPAVRYPTYDPEYLWNYEIGVKTQSQDRRVYADLALFYMRRRDMQVRTGEQLIPNDPNSYTFVTRNASKAENYGIEASAHWLPTASLDFGASLGLLHTSQKGLMNEAGEPVPERAQSHAPEYQAQLNATYRHPLGYMARVDFSVRDEFYFDVPTDHDQQSDSYTLTNFKAGYETARWSVYAYVHNLFDEEYAMRGFYFGNEPPNWADKLYLQNGDPRTFGLRVEWQVQ